MKKLGARWLGLLSVLVCGSGFAQNGPPPFPTQCFGFPANFETGWTIEPPLAYTTNLISVPLDVQGLWGDALFLDTTNLAPARLAYYVIDTNYHANLSYGTGTILFLFAANWASVSQGGTGPGETAYFLSAGDTSTNGLFAVYADKYGSNIFFGGVSNGVSTTYASAPISWTSNTFHEIGIEYTAPSPRHRAGTSTIYLDGAVAATGSGESIIPWLGTGPNGYYTNGFYIGSDSSGYEQMRGTLMWFYTWTEAYWDYSPYWPAISNAIVAWQATLGSGGFGAMMGMGGGVLTSGGSSTNSITGTSVSLSTQTSQTAGTGSNTTVTAATTPEQIAAIRAARAATDAAYFSNNVAPYLVPDLGITSDALQRQIVTNLLILSSNLNSMQTAQHAAVSNLLQRQTIPMPQSWIDSHGHSCYFDHMNADGSPAIKVTQGIDAVETVGAQNLWPSSLWHGASTGFGLNGSTNGSNILLAQWDAGDVLTNHQEFVPYGTSNSRVSVYTHSYEYYQSNAVDPHATFVAGIMIAAGVSNAAIGFAPQAQLVESWYANDLAGMAQMAATNNVRESNHSYLIPAGWIPNFYYQGSYYWLWVGDPSISTTQSWLFGFYDGYAASNTDQIVYTAKNYLPVFCAGNPNGEKNGEDFRGPDIQPWTHVETTNNDTNFLYIYSLPYTLYTYPAYIPTRPLNDAPDNGNGYNTLTAYAVSKNTLVVGAVYPDANGYSDPSTNTIAYFSAMGPTADGRIKPDVVADGVNEYSCGTNGASSYISGWDGTSFAAPAVTGSLGLITELYNEYYGTTNPPLASTLRGIMIHTADQLGTNAGPSYMYGWGLIDPVAAANLVQSNYASQSLAFIKEVLLTNGDRIVFPVTLTNGHPFRATITWTDPPGKPVLPALNPTNHMLTNDLDLRVISPGGTTNFPYVLNPASPGSPATQTNNDVDNVEQVYIPSPATGIYTVQITHKGTLVDDHGKTNYQNVSIMLSGNVAQPAIPLQIASIQPIAASNTIALAWGSDVGRVYSVQTETNIASANWQSVTGELSATKTTTAFVLTSSSTTNMFYRIVQIR
jgi:hypothetical protein